MKRAWALFVDDLRRLRGNVATGIVVLGLIALPSIFSWYNMLASWDVFENTGNLSVAVANVDEGYESDLVPVKINVGDQVISGLRANDQIHWVFTDEEDAIDGAKSGRYYAAVVIPESFSRDMMTFYSDDSTHAEIIYYSNEKKNAIAPKMTDQGADAISEQVNQIFTETLSDTALGIAQSLATYADKADVDGRIGDLAEHVSSLGADLSKASSVLRAYSSILGSSQDLIADSAELLSSTRESAAEVSAQVGELEASAGDIAGAMSASMDALSAALEASAASFAGVSASVDAAFDSLDATSASAASSLRTSAAGLDAQAQSYRDIVAQLEQVQGSVPSEYQPAIASLIAQLNISANLMDDLSSALVQGAADLEAGTADVAALRAEIKQKVEAAQAAVDQAKSDYDANIAPNVEALVSTAKDLGAFVGSTAQKLDAASASLVDASGSVSEKMDAARAKLDATAASLDESAADLDSLAAEINAALVSGDADKLREVLSGDASSLASALAAPVELDRHVLFPVDNFGSAMSPLYTTLALWIGALLIMVAIVVVPTERAMRNVGELSLPQQFIGRFGVVSVLTFAQDTLLALGNMFFLGVQVNNPLLYLLCFWVSGQVFSFIIYTLVVSFANLGKALAVILLILQVAGAGGAYPLALLPPFFQDVSVWLPATHVIDAMRAAMFGVYQGDFWVEMGIVVLYVLPFALLGLVLRNPTMKLVDWFVEQVEKSKVV